MRTVPFYRHGTDGIGESSECAQRCDLVKRIGALAFTAALVATTLTGCSSNTPAAAPKIIIFAAASLTKSFTEIGKRFTADNPGSEIEFSFAGSSDLVTQLTQGAPADVFASADIKNMTRAAAAGLLAGDPVNFASNTLTIAVAPGNPMRISSLKDLAREDVSVVVCAPAVPCGSATQKVEQAAGVRLNPVSEETSVTDVLNKVVTGQSDAGLVYVTDVRGAGDKVTGVGLPEAAGAVNTYPIAVLHQSAHADLARKFVDLVIGESGRRILDAAGFATP